MSCTDIRYNPLSHHNGPMWLHDSALVAFGLARYGFVDEVLRLTSALFDAASLMDLRRLPELFCGFRREARRRPTLYPVACAPKTWSAATPFALLQAWLGMECDDDAQAVRSRA